MPVASSAHVHPTAIISAEADISSDVHIGPYTIVEGAVTIGDGCLLAARSSAFRDLPPGQVCMGEPARAMHPRFEAAPTTNPTQPLAA